MTDEMHEKIADLREERKMLREKVDGTITTMIETVNGRDARIAALESELSATHTASWAVVEANQRMQAELSAQRARWEELKTWLVEAERLEPSEDGKHSYFAVRCRMMADGIDTSAERVEETAERRHKDGGKK